MRLQRHIDQEEAGRETAEWLVEKLGGKGNIVVITGVPGTSVDTLRTKAAKEVFAKHPDIKIVAEAVGMWSQAVARTEMSKILATQNWDRHRRAVDAGRLLHRQRHAARSRQEADASFCPAPAKARTAAASRCCRPAPRSKARLPLLPDGRAAHLLCLAALFGRSGAEARGREAGGQGRAEATTLPLPLVTNETHQVVRGRTWEEMKAGCNAFKPSLVPNPGWFASIFSEQTPEIGFQARAGRSARDHKRRTARPFAASQQRCVPALAMPSMKDPSTFGIAPCLLDQWRSRLATSARPSAPRWRVDGVSLRDRAAAACMRCSARTAPASRPSSSCCPG